MDLARDHVNNFPRHQICKTDRLADIYTVLKSWTSEQLTLWVLYKVIISIWSKCDDS